MGNIQNSSDGYKEGRGYCLILNNVKFVRSLSRGHEDRLGSNRNEEEIRTTFQARGFKVDTLTDNTASEITEELQKLQNRKNYNSLFIFFLSHGYQGGIYGTDGVCLSFAEIQYQITATNCPAFSGKPKILVFPTCRMGEGNDSGTRAIDDDFLLAFATQPHFPAYRDEELGSYYIRQLLLVIQKKGDEEDLISILTEVKRIMRDQRDTVYQSPDYHSSLTDKVFLKTKKRHRIVTGKAGQKVTPTSSVEDTLSEELEVNNPNGDINIEVKSINPPVLREMSGGTPETPSNSTGGILLLPGATTAAAAAARIKGQSTINDEETETQEKEEEVTESSEPGAETTVAINLGQPKTTEKEVTECPKTDLTATTTSTIAYPPPTASISASITSMPQSRVTEEDYIFIEMTPVELFVTEMEGDWLDVTMTQSQ